MEGVGGRRVWAPAQSRARVANSARFRAESAAVRPEFAARQLTSKMEMSGYLVGSAAFKAVGTGDPRPAGSIPVHLRQWVHGRPLVCFEGSTRWGIQNSIHGRSGPFAGRFRAGTRGITSSDHYRQPGRSAGQGSIGIH
jgi:hypothetical protein